MHKLDILRKTLQIFSLFVFMYQTVTFLQRYHESPTIITTSLKMWDESYRPRLLVCDSKLFNVTRSRQLGYKWYGKYLSGDVIGLNSSISWRGKHKSSWNEVESFLFPNINNVTTSIEFYRQTSERIVLLKHLEAFTVCNEIVDFGQKFYLGLTKDVSIYMVDPHRFINHRLNILSMKGDNIALPDINESSHSKHVYASVSTTVLEKRTDTGICKQHATDTEYTECVENGYINLFNKTLGCLPPWFRQENYSSMNVCTKQIDFKDEKSALEAKAQLLAIIVDTESMKDSKFESDLCLPSCQQLIYNVEISRSEKGSYDQNWVQFKFADVVNVETETNGYDSFRLIVEVGSSLGLWLGLCIIGIFDLVIKGVPRLLVCLIRYYEKCTHRRAELGIQQSP